MAMIWVDGFDEYSAALMSSKYVSSNGITFGSPGRFGYGNYCAVNPASGGTFSAPINPGSNTIISGAAIWCNGSLSVLIPQLFRLANAYLSINSDGSVSWYNGSATVATSAAGVILPTSWNYIEVSVALATTATGSVTIRVNGAAVATAASVITSVVSGPYTTMTFSAAGTPSMFVDDWYVFDNTGTANNAFAGDAKVVPLYPAGNGRVNNWNRVGGTSSGNWTAVNEVPPDGDTSYVYSTTIGAEDCYTLTALSNVAQVLGVVVEAYARKDDSPSRVLGLGVGNGSVENFDAGHAVATSYTYLQRRMDINPLTGVAWNVTDFTTLQAAIQLIS